jgi:hypothetical protein
MAAAELKQWFGSEANGGSSILVSLNQTIIKLKLLQLNNMILFVEHFSRKTQSHRHITISYNRIYLSVVLLSRQKKAAVV